MRKNGVILVNPYHFGNDIEYLAQRLIQEFKLLDVFCDMRKCQAEISYVADGAIVVKDFPYDFVVYLDKDKYQAALIEKGGYRVFNKALSIELCDDKMKTYIALSNQGIKMPLTLPGPFCFVDSEPDKELMNKIEKLLQYPLVIKGSYGSMGKNVYLINNRKELLEKAKELIKKPHLYQQYVSSSYGRDIRVIVINKKACAWMLRKSEEDFRSNLAAGGSGQVIDIANSYLVLAEKAATILDLDYCGVDILIGENQEPILCEVNSNAFITGIEKTTGINVAALYCQHIYTEIYQK